MPGNNNSNSEQYKLITLDNLSTYTGYIEEKNIQVTRAQYTDLPSTKLTDGKSYYITDEGIIIKNGVTYGGAIGTDTTYSLSAGTGDDANKIILTPSSGNPDKVTVPYATNAGTVNSHTVASDVPANAVFTDNDTTYGLSVGTGTDANKIVLTPSTGTADKITVPYASDAGSVNGKTVSVNVPADAKFTDTTYTDATTSASGLMSSTDKTKLDGIASGAEVNVQADWNETSSSSDAYIQNKPSLGTAALRNIPTSGDASNSEVVLGADSRLSDARPASDVSSWAKASTKPTYTASEVGAIATTAKGANNGVAELDSTGKVPSSQLPSYVDDVLEYNSSSDFPLTGESGKIYIAKDTNKTYRWSGTAYVEISESLALGETSSTAFRGDHGKTAYDHATDSSRLTTTTASGLYKIGVTSEGHVSSATAVQKSDITALGIPAQDTTYSVASNSGIALNGTTFSNSGVRAVGEGTTNGTISVNTNGTTADVAVKGLGERAFDDTDYLPLTGGTLSGAVSVPELYFQGANDKNVGFIPSGSGTNIDIGWSWANKDGAGMALRSVDFPSVSSEDHGAFHIWARTEDNTCQLDGYSSGKLTWNNKRVVTSTNGSAVGSANTPVYIDANGYATPISDYETYAYAPVVTIPDAVPSNLADCKVKIEPIQDLHGYGNPWVGGADKNKFATSFNQLDTQYIGCDEFTVDAGDYVFKFKNTSSSDISFWASDTSDITDTTNHFVLAGQTASVNYTVGAGGKVKFSMRYNPITSGITPSDITEIALYKSNDVPDTFTPYENICPITGHTQAVVTDTKPNMYVEGTAEIKVAGNWGYDNTVNASTATDLSVVGNVISGSPSSYRWLHIPFHFEKSRTIKLTESGVINLAQERVSNNTGSRIDGFSSHEYTPNDTFDGFIDIAINPRSDTYFKIGISILDEYDIDDYNKKAINRYTINLNGTRYGGVLDVDSGVMTVTHIKEVLTGNEDAYNYGASSGCYGIRPSNTAKKAMSADDYCSIATVVAKNYAQLSDNEACMQDNVIFVIKSSAFPTTGVEDFKQYIADLYTAGTPVECVLELATPFTIQLTPTQIKLLQGTNTLYASTGDISVTANGIASAIGNMQEQIDYNLTTDSKEVVGSINELNDQLNGENETYDFAPIITIEDNKVPSNLADCKVKIEPVQDLHGYGKPWVGGAGKNKINIADKASSTSGSVTASCSKGVITLSGTATEQAYFSFPLGSELNMLPSLYKIALNNTGNTSYIAIKFCRNGNTIHSWTPNVINRVISDWTATENETIDEINIEVANGYPSNMSISIVVMDKNGTDTSFAPYTNICPISGSTEAVVTRDGKNLFNKNGSKTDNKFLTSSGNTTSDPNWYITDFVKVLGGANIVLHWNDSYTANAPSICWYDKNKNFIGGKNYGYSNPVFVTLPSNACYIKFSAQKSSIESTLQVEYGSSPTTYEPYNGNQYTVQLGDTIYGGTLDVDSGVMNISHALMMFDGTENWQSGSSTGNCYRMALNISNVAPTGDYPSFSNELEYLNNFSSDKPHFYIYNSKIYVFVPASNETEFKSFLSNNPLQVCYKLYTSTILYINPTQIQLLLGTNNLYASTGDISVTTNNTVNSAIEQLTDQVNELAENYEDVIGWSERINLFDKNAKNTANGYVDGKSLSNDGAENTNSGFAISEYIPVTAGKNYTMQALTGYYTAVCCYTENKTFIEGFGYYNQSIKTINAPENSAYLRFTITKANVDITQLEEGDTATPYVQYHPVIGPSVESLLSRVPAPPTSGADEKYLRGDGVWTHAELPMEYMQTGTGSYDCTYRYFRYGRMISLWIENITCSSSDVGQELEICTLDDPRSPWPVGVTPIYGIGIYNGTQPVTASNIAYFYMDGDVVKAYAEKEFFYGNAYIVFTDSYSA